MPSFLKALATVVIFYLMMSETFGFLLKIAPPFKKITISCEVEMLDGMKKYILFWDSVSGVLITSLEAPFVKGRSDNTIKTIYGKTEYAFVGKAYDGYETTLNSLYLTYKKTDWSELGLPHPTVHEGLFHSFHFIFDEPENSGMVIDYEIKVIQGAHIVRRMFTGENCSYLKI